MKRNLVYIIIFLCSFLFVSLSFAKLTATPHLEVNLTVPPLLTAKQVTDLIEQQTKTVGQNKVITLDEIYADYGEDLILTMVLVDKFLQPKENLVFGKDDRAFFIKSNTVYILSQKNTAGAIIIGIAILNNREVVNILIAEGKVYVYDIEEHGFRTPDEYIVAGFKFALIII